MKIKDDWLKISARSGEEEYLVLYPPHEWTGIGVGCGAGSSGITMFGPIFSLSRNARLEIWQHDETKQEGKWEVIIKWGKGNKK